MTVYVEALSLVNALGEDDAILANLAEGRAPGMEGSLVRTVDGFEAPFGRVTIDLPDTKAGEGRRKEHRVVLFSTVGIISTRGAS